MKKAGKNAVKHNETVEKTRETEWDLDPLPPGCVVVRRVSQESLDEARRMTQPGAAAAAGRCLNALPLSKADILRQPKQCPNMTLPPAAPVSERRYDASEMGLDEAFARFRRAHPGPWTVPEADEFVGQLTGCNERTLRRHISTMLDVGLLHEVPPPPDEKLSQGRPRYYAFDERWS